MKSLFKLLIIVLLAIVIRSQYDLYNISGYYVLAIQYMPTNCSPLGVNVMYGNNGQNAEFTFEFPYTAECYNNYSINGTYSMNGTLIVENTLSYIWESVDNNACGVSQGLISINSSNIVIKGAWYFDCSLEISGEFTTNKSLSTVSLLPFLPQYLGIHSYIYPNYANNESCYPLMLQIQNNSYYNTTTNNIYNFTWIWQNSSACFYYGLYGQSQGIATFTPFEAGAWNWTFYYDNLTIQGNWTLDNELMEVVFFEPFFNSYTMVASIPSTLSLNGIWGVNTYLNPDYYSIEYCYPSTLQFIPSNDLQNNNGLLAYLYYLDINIPCISQCQTSCGSWYTQFMINGTSGDSYWGFYIELNYINSLSGWWDSVNNTITIYQNASDSLFSYMLVQINQDDDNMSYIS